MKKLLSFFVLLTIMITMVSCASAKTANPIDYGKKYLLDDNRYYVFEKDQTGYCEYYYNYDIGDSEYHYTLSARLDFVWREASDGAVYLFETKATYYEDHTEGKEIELISNPIYFSEDFLTYFRSTQYGGYSVNYIKEGSELEKSLNQ